MKLIVSLITIAVGGIGAFMFLKRKAAFANALIPAAIRPTLKKTRSVRRKNAKPRAKLPRAHSTPAKPRPVHHKRNGLKAHSAN